MKNLLLLIFIYAPVLLYSYSWPVDNVDLTATFCENRGDHLHTGVDIGGGEQQVSPIAAGKVIFRYIEGDYSSIPTGLGNFVVVEHAGRIRSVYCHLRAGTVKEDPDVVDTDDILGVSGNSGSSYGSHLHLAVIDVESASFLNPLSVLPIIEDNHPPVVKKVFFLRNGRMGMEELQSGRTLPPAQVEILAEVYDVREKKNFLWKTAPYRITVNVSGQETSRSSFDALRVQEGILMLSHADKSFQDLYHSAWVYRLGSIELTVGDIHLQVIASDYYGNNSIQEVFLRIRK